MIGTAIQAIGRAGSNTGPGLSVLLLVENGPDRRLLAEVLAGEGCAVVESTSPETMTGPIDVAVVDGPALRGWRNWLLARRGAEHPALLPVLLVGDRPDLARGGEDPLDEVIASPVDPLELRLRLAGLFLIRRMSLAREAEADSPSAGPGRIHHRTQEERIRLLQAALESAANAVLIADRQGVIEWVNPAFTQLTGYAAEETIGQRTRLLKSGAHEAGVYRQLWETVLAGQVWRGELFNRRKDGTVYPEEQTITPVRSQDGEITHFVSVKSDISERRRQQEQITRLAMQDALTDLPNRRSFQEHLVRTAARAHPARPASLLLLDLDHIKIVNDTLGHAAGDQLLRKVAQVLRRTIRPGDFLARLGGDEFAIVLEQTPLDTARPTAERVRVAVGACRFEVGGHRFDVSTSVGLALIDGEREPQSLLALADTALYAAKRRGRNRVVVNEPGADDQAHLVQATALATRIKEALRDQAFELAFQPVVHLATGRVGHVEALLRLHGSPGPPVGAGDLILSAERFGLITDVDRWVFDAAVEAVRRHPGPALFVNVSGISVGDETFVEHVERRLERGDVPPGRIGFEITETAVVADVLRAQAVMARLRQRGCPFALDDFGKGVSSFSYLRSLPADYVKIDGGFVRTLEEDPANRAIVRAVASVARALGKQVVAEWVETPSIAHLLRDMEVEYGQGYVWGRPSGEWPRPAFSLS